MDYRRRPSIFGLILLAGALSFGSAFANSLSSEAPASSVRTLVPDAVYAAGVTADFSNLQLRDAARTSIVFAACPLHDVEQTKLDVPVLAVPDLARPILDSSGQLRYERPAGAGPIEALKYWIVDFRKLDTPIRELQGVPPISELRDSPSLRQWSAPIRFTQNADELQLSPRPLKFVRLEPSSALSWPQPNPQISVDTQRESAQRRPHWYQPKGGENGIYANQRKLAVIAARVINPTANGPVILLSRQGPWDAWKPRGRWDALQNEQILRFSGVSDPQWRLQGLESGSLELAHAAHELRISGLQAGQQILLTVSPAQRRATSVSCLNDDSWPPRQALNWRTIETDDAQTDAGPANLRKGFLILLAIVSASIVAYRNIKRRS